MGQLESEREFKLVCNNKRKLAYAKKNTEL